MKAFATFLLTAVLIALVPLTAMGAGKGGGSWGGGWGGGSGLYGGYGRYGDGYGYGRYGGYWRNGLWYSGPDYYYTQPYVAARPVFSGEPIKITNPLTSRTALSYTLNGTVYTIQPGYSQEFVEDRDWVIDFSRGPSLGEARYGLHGGNYMFRATGNGWELFNVPAVTPSSGAPVNPPATSPGIPVNPAP